MVKSKRSKLSINEQLTQLNDAIAFIEQTTDIDAAIQHYESALKQVAQLSSDLQSRAQHIETLKLTHTISPST